MRLRIAELDGLRGLLSVIVVLGHIQEWVVPWFWGCMEIFYALSGFLITYICIDGVTKTGFWRSFLSRRILRIWPVYFTVLAFCVLAHLVWSSAVKWSALSPLGFGALQSAFFLQNIEYLTQVPAPFSFPRPGYILNFDHSWSVALEEQFYLLAPFICLLCVRMPLKRIMLLSGTVATVSLFLRLCGLHYWVLPARLDGFAAGVFLAFLWRCTRDGQLSATLLSGLGTIGLSTSSTVLAVFLLWAHYTRMPELQAYFAIGIFLFAFFAMSLIAFLLAHNGQFSTRFFRSRVLRFLGDISYSTYLWHIPLLWYLNAVVPFNDLLSSIPFPVVAIPAILAASYTSFLLFERPFFAMRQRMRRAQPADAPRTEQLALQSA